MTLLPLARFCSTNVAVLPKLTNSRERGTEGNLKEKKKGRKEEKKKSRLICHTESRHQSERAVEQVAQGN